MPGSMSGSGLSHAQMSRGVLRRPRHQQRIADHLGLHGLTHGPTRDAPRGYGFFLPAKATPEARRRAAAYLQPALAHKDVIDSLVQVGMEVQSSTPDQLADRRQGRCRTMTRHCQGNRLLGRFLMPRRPVMPQGLAGFCFNPASAMPSLR